ncbi:hypothetical protein [Natrinema sp. 1APR25-10V2]|uniref:hypothetical protein n=1 Tax=Natrinema sp. 1APR25-10V2 TaxID=2951081 RepID=UPI0028743233|nr:hypothetical protein [Natrinema sp. 1APR25-10V2]MDS0476568.1 hypothetical protein [Natrinema sp. 1APR25-10V2]
MVSPLQLFGVNPLGGLVLSIVVPLLVVAGGTYLGVLMALQTFFDASSWREATSSDASDE